jgi:ElaB/YqjD/DUF883 family membrane-anchored ribosome-binding protein
MGKTTDEIEQEIVQARDRLDRDLQALKARIREAVDWRAHFRRNPAAFVGTAFCVGAMMGWLAFRRRGPAR